MVAKSFSVILCSVVMVILSTTQANSEFESRIVGGKPVNILKRPFQVAILPQGFICGGSLIKANAVLTAAHCVENILPSKIKVRAGSNYFNKGGIVRRAIKTFVNKFYDPKTMKNDIAILKIQTFRQDFIRPGIAIISLATNLPRPGTSVVVSGYGTLSSGGSVATQLQQVTVAITDKKYCNKQYQKVLTNSMFCAGAIGKDSCQGDSGGPVTYNGTLIGVVSWGYGCADRRYPGIYTSVPIFNSWIKSTLKNFK